MAKKKEKYSFVANGHKYYRCMVHGKTITANTLEDMMAKKERQLRIDEMAANGFKNVTIGEFSEHWYERKAQLITDGASRPYAYSVAWIQSTIGNVPLIDSTPQLLINCVEKFAETKSKTTGKYPSQKYINHLTSVLKMIFKEARNQLILEWNYAEDIKVKAKGNPKPNPHRSLSKEEQKRVLEFEHPMRLFCCFLMLCGLMPSEACALRWKDITYNVELESYVFQVKNTVELSSNRKSKFKDDLTKTEYRKRSITIPDIMNDLIEKGKLYHKRNELIFTDKKGGLISESALKSRWRSYLIDMDIYYCNKKNKYDPTRTEEDKRLSIKKFTPYDLRHTFATNLANNNVHPVVIASLMGHSDIRTTNRYYIDKSQIDNSNAIKEINKSYLDILNNQNN